MNKRLFTTALLALMTLLTYAQGLFVGSYNIRYDNKDDVENGNAWSRRVSVICGQILFEQPDLFGTQESLHHQVLDLKASLPGYDYIGIGRDDGKEKGEYECIWYNTDKFQLLDSGNFWLSETPEKPSLGWDAACIRICTWGRFEQKDPKDNIKEVFYFNLHMDHVGVIARREAAKLIVSRIREIAQGKPCIVTGDFNVDQHNEIYTIFTESGILKDSYTAAKQRFAENGTFNSFKPELKTDSRIDHIFVSPEFSVEHYAIMTNLYWSEVKDTTAQKGHDAPTEISFKRHQIRMPSDHYPVWAKLKLAE